MDLRSRPAPPRVFCFYSEKDEDARAQLGIHLQVLEEAGLIQVLRMEPGSWRVDKLECWASETPEIQQTVREVLGKADILLILISADLLAAKNFSWLAAQIAGKEKKERCVVIPVLVRACSWQHDKWVGTHHAVPIQPISSRGDPDNAWREVIQEIRRCVLPLEDIFKTAGQPNINFVEPAQMQDLIDNLRNMGRGLVVEGPSGIGKTTAVKHALERARRCIRPHPPVHWLDGKKKKDVDKLTRLVQSELTSGGYLVIDDFHRLEIPIQSEVANLIKIVSDEDRRDAKITLVGINPVGMSLVQGFHDLTGRFATVYMGRQPDEKIAELIEKGQAAANIVFQHKDQFIKAAAGSFFTAQLLCYQACLREGIHEIQMEPRSLEIAPSGYVTEKVQQELAAKYHDALCAFASLDERPPPRGACLVLLWLLQQSPDQSITMQIARMRYPQLSAAFDWLMESNLWTRIHGDNRIRQRFYYRRDAAILSADDPQLEFYLRNLNWERFIRDTGHKPTGADRVGWDPIVGPLIGESAPATVHVEDTPVPSLPESYVLHLSDLHFGTREQADLWSEQLILDLTQDVRVPRIDVVVLSGDIANRSTLPEYQAASRFLQELKDAFSLTPQQIVLTPGNHDLSWEQSRRSYTPVRRADVKAIPEEGTYVDGGNYVEVRDEDEYAKRFAEFSAFYHQVRLENYPLDYERQATLHHFVGQRLLFLALNSAWSLDHHYRERAGIHLVALGQALRLLRNTSAYAECLKIAVWHHPLSSEAEDRIKDSGFVELLAQAGFRLALHGHIHKAQASTYRHDVIAAGRRIDVLSAGTFGAPVREWVPGYPLQYQILRFSGDRLRVHTRRRRHLMGAWEPDASWLQGPGMAPLPSYEISLSGRP